MVTIGNHINLKATITPTNATNQTIKWSSSNTKIASVSDNGVVTGISEGEVTITAKADNKSHNYKIKVNPINVSSVNVTPEKVELYVNKTKTLNATISPSNATNKNLTYKSSNSKIATVSSNGIITALKKGTATITITSNNGKKDTVKVTVKELNLVKSISLNKTTLSLEEGKSEILIASITPSDAINKNIIWSSSNTNVATVVNGKITAIKAGTTTITVKSEDGNHQATCVVKVTEKIIPVTGIKLNASSGTIYLNSKKPTVKLIATISPTNATNKNITWSSSNTNVATVNNGIVTAKNQGSATISAKTNDGSYQATYKVTVKKKVIVVVTASQGKRMCDWFKEYNSKNGYYYKNEYYEQCNECHKTDSRHNNTICNNTESRYNNTLKYVYLSGSGFDFQVGDGLKQAINFLNDNYKSLKNYTEISLFFTMTGNSVRKYDCDTFSESTEYESIARDYNKAINSVINQGYDVKGYIASHSPLQDDPNKNPYRSNHKIVKSTSDYACKENYRSNWKYYLSNQKMISVLKNGYPNITFVDYFNKFLTLTDKTNRIFAPIEGRSISTDLAKKDGLHWDEATTKDCMQILFDLANM